MKCYNHHDRDAFGICKVCGKGLCLECLKEDKGVIICNNAVCSDKYRKIKTGVLVALILLVAIFLKLTIFG